MAKSKIKELFKDPKTVYIFDVDGVLAPIEYGEYTHYELDDEAWARELLKEDFYQDRMPFKAFQVFLKDKEESKG